MNLAAVSYTRMVSAPLSKTLLLIRRALLNAGLNIVGELDISHEPCLQPGTNSRSCVVLLVDSPVLVFEAVALDRAGAAFVPVHIVVSGERDMSFVHWANPATVSGLRPPAAAKIPLERLSARITQALERIPDGVK
jgi:hypothetical protein